MCRARHRDRRSATTTTIEEEDTGGFVQADFSTEVLGSPLRGNLGVRYVETKQTSSGFTFTAGAPLLTTVERTYDDTLPSLNLVARTSRTTS